MMKIAINILKVLEIIMSAIWGIIFGILAPLSLMYGGIADEAIADHFVLKLWLINSIVCYIIGTIILMLGAYKTALGFHAAGLIVSIVIYGIFQGMFESQAAASNPAQLYMPIIFLTFITLAINIIANFKKITAKLSQSNDKKYEAAPSVLGGEYKIDKPDNKKRKKK